MTPDELMERAEAEVQRQAGLAEQIFVCTGSGCNACGAEGVKKALQAEVKQQGRERVEVAGTGCMGLCSKGPRVRRASDEAHFHSVTVEDAAGLVRGEPVAHRALDMRQPFFARQHRVVLSNIGRVDPGKLDSSLAAGAYQALARALTMTPEQVVNEVTVSGLRGRGGAGYPTGLKWQLVRRQVSDTKYVICNGDEGDPGAFMDRAVLELDPHRVLEGMAIAGYAVGASRGYLYVRGEYELAVERLATAIKQAEREGILGNRVLDSTFQFHCEVRIGAGAFVCGEETALIASVEGRRGEPRPRPPYPPEKGLWGKPTLINNVETFANVAPILREGGAWFASMGTEKSRGTKVFAVAGKARLSGLIEVPMGTSLRDIVTMAGGVESGTVKAVQTGGPSGGCIPERLLDIPVDYESLVSVGSMMGSGGLIVMDDSTSIVDVARYFMEFCRDESCGKCIPCRAGTVQMHDLLAKFSRGEGTPEALAMLEELAELLRSTSLCGLGQSAPNPVMTALQYFPGEFAARMVRPEGHR